MPTFVPPSQSDCFGLTEPDLVTLAQSHTVKVHRLLLQPWHQLQAAAKEAGFDPQIISGYRDFSRQCHIWHSKACGLRPILDDSGNTLLLANMSRVQLLQAIMRFSAVPGASRHHWACDIDIYDAAAVEADYQVQLTPQEVAPNGVFGGFHAWLDRYLMSAENPGFFRPYQVDNGGIAPERWHLSYAPLAMLFQQQLQADALLALWHEHEVDLLAELRSNLESLWQTHIWVDWALYPREFRPC